MNPRACACSACRENGTGNGGQSRRAIHRVARRPDGPTPPGGCGSDACDRSPAGTPARVAAGPELLDHFVMGDRPAPLSGDPRDAPTAVAPIGHQRHVDRTPIGRDRSLDHRQVAPLDRVLRGTATETAAAPRAQQTRRITPEVSRSSRWTIPTYGRDPPRVRDRYRPARSSSVSGSAFLGRLGQQSRRLVHDQDLRPRI